MPEIKSVSEAAKQDDDIALLKRAENMPLVIDNKLQEDSNNDNNIVDSNSVLECPISTEVIQKLTDGLLVGILPDLQKVQKSLNELRQSQRVIIETVQQENSKFQECQATFNLSSIFAKTKTYYTKLMNIKKEMTILHDKSVKLKKRAMKIKQQKEKEALYKEQQREREAEREKQLIAKMAAKT